MNYAQFNANQPVPSQSQDGLIKRIWNNHKTLIISSSCAIGAGVAAYAGHDMIKKAFTKKEEQAF